MTDIFQFRCSPAFVLGLGEMNFTGGKGGVNEFSLTAGAFKKIIKDKNVESSKRGRRLNGAERINFV